MSAMQAARLSPTLTSWPTRSRRASRLSGRDFKVSAALTSSVVVVETVSASRLSRIPSRAAIRAPTPSTARDNTSPASRKRPSTDWRAASRRASIGDPWRGENVDAEVATEDAKVMKTPDKLLLQQYRPDV